MEKYEKDWTSSELGVGVWAGKNMGLEVRVWPSDWAWVCK